MLTRLPVSLLLDTGPTASEHVYAFPASGPSEDSPDTASLNKNIINTFLCFSIAP